MAFKSELIPIVSIIVPLHNHAGVVGASIESCLTQAYPNVEVIVVDDCSSDPSVEVVRRYEPRVRIIRAPRPIGACRARNVGLSHAIGEFVLFHESDDLLFADRLWHDLAAVAREPRTDVVISINRWFKDGEPPSYDGEPVCRRERRLLRHMALVSGATESSLVGMLQYGGPQHSCLLYRTSVVRALGGYIDGTEAYADRDLLFRALCRGATVTLNPRVTSAWRLHDCPNRMTPATREGDHEQRLALARRYAAALEEVGLLRHGPLRRALIAHVTDRVYHHARRRMRQEVAHDALRLIGSLRAIDEQMRAMGAADDEAAAEGVRDTTRA